MHVPARRSGVLRSSREPHARVEHGICEVHEQVHGEEDGSHEEDAAGDEFPVPLEDGLHEQDPVDWWSALGAAVSALPDTRSVSAVALSGSMQNLIALRADGTNPLATLKQWLAQAGLVCTRLRPLDLDGRHVVLAVAQADGTVSAAA